MSLIINAISAVGNNSSVYPLLVRDCGIEAPAKVVQTYNQNAKDSKRMATHATRERLIDEYGTSAVWMGGVPVVEAIANKIIQTKTGLNGNVSLQLLETKKNSNVYKDVAQNIEINIQKFKDKAPEAVKDLLNIKANAAKYKNISNRKYAIALVVPMAIMGFVLPKANFGLTKYLIGKDIKSGKLPNPNKMPDMKKSAVSSKKGNPAFESLNSMKKSNTPSFKGLGTIVGSLSQTQKMAVTDGGLAVGRVGTSRGTNEKIESLFKAGGMLLLNFVAPKYIEKILDKGTQATFGIDTALDPKIMADKRFLVQVKKNKLELPKKEAEVLDFIDNNPESMLAKYTKKNKLVKFLDNGVRDPREFVNTEKVMNLAKNMRKFANEASKSDSGVLKYAKKAIAAKSFNIVANVAISSALLAIALPQAQFALRRFISGSNVDPGLIVADNKESKKMDIKG